MNVSQVVDLIGIHAKVIGETSGRGEGMIAAADTISNFVPLTKEYRVTVFREGVYHVPPREVYRGTDRQVANELVQFYASCDFDVEMEEREVTEWQSLGY